MAEYEIPSVSQANWEPGVDIGIIGGIPAERANIINVTESPYSADVTGETDAKPAIQAAIDAATADTAIYCPAGTYKLETGLRFLPAKRNVTLFGEGDSTIFESHLTTGKLIFIGSESDYDWSFPSWAISGSLSAGQSVLTVADTSDLSLYANNGIGRLCQISVDNEVDETEIESGAAPVFSVKSFLRIRRFTSRIIASTSTTITIDPPLVYDMPARLNPKISIASAESEDVGIEGIKLDLINQTGANNAIWMQQAHQCWVRNVTSRDTPNYHVAIADSLRCELRRSDLRRRQGGGTSGAALLMSASTACLIEDNILTNVFPLVEINDSCAGNAFLYNFAYNSNADASTPGAAIDTNHNPHNSHNLYEGNIAPNVQCDGWFGGSSHDTVYRNWLTGSNNYETDIRGYCVKLNRITRGYNIIGNILGTQGLTSYIYQFGYPNLGNEDFSGEATPSAGDYWTDWAAMLAASPGAGPGASGFQEKDLDVEATTILKANYNTEIDGIPAGESLGGDTLKPSLARGAKPSYFGPLPWPPFDSSTGVTSFEAIPAGYRFVNGEDPGEEEPVASLTVGTLNVTALTLG